MSRAVTRHGSVVRLRPEREAEYRRLHAAVWPEVLEQISRCGLRNYTIFLRDGLLFSYFEYVGGDLEADLRVMGEHVVTQKWWELTNPCQEPVSSAEEGQWWAPLEEVFHAP